MIIQEMSESDCLNVLAGARLGRLACAHDNQPYVVPMYYVYDNGYLYGFTTLGKKVEWMRSNPLVCVELDEVEGDDGWMSIVVFGRYEELPDVAEQDHPHEPWRRTIRRTWPQPERLHAHELLQQHADWWEPGCASCKWRNPDQPLTPIYYRIHIDRISGRRTTHQPAGRSFGSWMTSPARESEDWLRRIFHALCKPFA
jgi:nitroimidazol reductase NimA-like FMN-containing flavoprotein (pyridoxamine 5'-phosphate oxidase superfamily)